MNSRRAGCSPGRVSSRAQSAAAASLSGPGEERCERASSSIRRTSGTGASASASAAYEAGGIASAGDAGLLRELREYRLTKQSLGEGAFAKVRLATSESTGHQVAVKIIKRKKLDGRAELLLQREVKHHEKLRHVNIVRLHTWIKGPTKYYLVMEYCGRGDLLQFVNRSGYLPEPLARRLFRHLMDGIAFCHRLGIHHRDLKLENLLLAGAEDAPDEQLVLKIADFGLSDLQTKPNSLSGTLCGSPLYAAPELMTEGAALDGYDATKTDIWSCGVILYALLASALPFDAGDVHALVRLIQLGKPTSPVPPERGADAEQLVHAMLSVDAKARPTASAVLEARWAMGTAAQIKASATQLTLPATAAGSGRRRGASETTQFFKQMRGQVEEEDSDPLRRNAAAGRAKGERLTRDELQKIKRSSEEERPQQPAQPAAPAPLSSVSATDAQPAGRRKGGAALTKEEREEIKRERAAAAALKTGPAS
mmetsp:Transcript_37559/g.123945  ORF Transcript_37559/g.123945 Transcript_37559/m.123945 type:complete len:481 (-) Transcript_37559:28-1470(-)